MPPDPIIPVGSAVVTLVELPAGAGRAGRPRFSPGLVVKAPVDGEHAYRVRFAGGDEVSLKRQEIEVLKHFQREGLDEAEDPLARFDLSRFVIFRAVIGSRAYGLEHDASDTDTRGIYLPPARLHWSIFGLPEQLEDDQQQSCFWELEKFLTLALKANPNVLETLYSPLVLHASEPARELLAMRGTFLTKLVYQTFSGYAMSQFRKLEQDVRTRGEIKWKHAMHLIRLLLAGVQALRTGELPVRIEEEGDRARLLAIRDGLTAWPEVDAWRRQLHGEFEDAFGATSLPDRPDYQRVNDYLIAARRSMVDVA